jgi:hypothetical protein
VPDYPGLPIANGFELISIGSNGDQFRQSDRHVSAEPVTQLACYAQ